MNFVSSKGNSKFYHKISEKSGNFMFAKEFPLVKVTSFHIYEGIDLCGFIAKE